jgi:hypothetical protein
MKKLITILSIIAAAAVITPSTAFSAEKKKPAADSKTEEKKDDSKKKDTYPLYGEVTAVTDSLLTIKGGEGKPDRKFDITKDTKIHNGDKPATVKDIKVGAWVGGLAKKEDKGNPEALNINVGVKQKSEKKDDSKTETPKKKKNA